jgi:hypothetical protein
MSSRPRTPGGRLPPISPLSPALSPFDLDIDTSPTERAEYITASMDQIHGTAKSQITAAVQSLHDLVRSAPSLPLTRTLPHPTPAPISKACVTLPWCHRGHPTISCNPAIASHHIQCSFTPDTTLSCACLTLSPCPIVVGVIVHPYSLLTFIPTHG